LVQAVQPGVIQVSQIKDQQIAPLEAQVLDYLPVMGLAVGDQDTLGQQPGKDGVQPPKSMALLPPVVTIICPRGATARLRTLAQTVPHKYSGNQRLRAAQGRRESMADSRRDENTFLREKGIKYIFSKKGCDLLPENWSTGNVRIS